MDGGLAGLGRRAIADGGLAGDQRRPVRRPWRCSMAAAIASGSWPSMRLASPAGGLEALHLIHRIGERQRPVDGNAVVVEQNDQPVELQMARERDRLLADALHEIAVGGQHIGEMIDDLRTELRRQMPLGDRHADRIGEPLPERPGRRLHARRDEVFRMARRQRAKLAEAPDLVERHLLVADQVQQRIDQHRAVAGRQHEAVAIRPISDRTDRISDAGEQHGGDIGRAHRQAGMARLGEFHRVHGKRADGAGQPIMFGARRW